MNILSGQTIPNFSENGANITTEQVLKNVRGTELQKYLNLLYTNKIVVHQKPQNIVSILKNKYIKNSKVVDVLSKYTTCDNYKTIVDELNLNALMNNNLSILSGGELQRLVCAITLMKTGNVFIFDEPTNYLDIEYLVRKRQVRLGIACDSKSYRIKMANLIKKLNADYIFVVDHDLAILDYIVDNVHIMYGEPGSYGVVSTLYSTAEGINIYFDGYIPADNIRFRKEPYKLFDIVETQNPIAKLTDLVSQTIAYDTTSITFDNFTLNIPKMTIGTDTNLVIILGKNGTGKTTYLNFLNNNCGLTVSFKQQIAMMNFPNPKITVKDFLYNEIRSSMTYCHIVTLFRM